MGEMILGLWTGQAGIVCNKAAVDKGGWDYLLQFPPPRVPPGVSSLDKVPPAASCLLQVKATDVLDPPDVKLDNWKRFADPALPSFFLVINFAGGDLPIEAFLIHVGEEWIGKVLKRLWKLPPERGDELHEHTMRLTWREEDRLPQLNGAALKAQIETCLGPDLLTYQERKRRWWETTGYEERARFRMSLVTSRQGDRDADEQLAEFAIGRLRQLPSTLTVAEEVRFGIPKPVRRDVPKDVIVTVNPLKPLKRVRVTFSTSTRRAHFDADLFAARAMFPFLKGNCDRYRFVCEDFELVVAPESGLWSMSLPGVDSRAERPLSALVAVGELILMHHELRTGTPSLEVSVKMEGATVRLFAGRPRAGCEFDGSALQLAEAASAAGFVARALNLAADLPVSADELVRWHGQLRALQALLGTDRKPLRIEGDVDAECPEDVELAFPLVAAAFIGKTLVLVASAIHSRPQFSATAAAGRKRFVIAQPSVDVVDSMVLEDGSHGTHPTAPFYEKIRSWIEEKNYTLLPHSTLEEPPDSPDPSAPEGV